MQNRPLMIFAAGFGTRMRQLTQDRPKPIIEVAGQPLIDHALDLAQAARCAPIVANLHYKADMLEQHLSPKGVVTLREEPEILETGGGLRNALPALGEGPVFTMNADAIWAGPNPLPLLAAAWQPDQMDALLMTVPIDQTVGHDGTGDFTLSDQGILTRGPGVVYGGVQIIKTEGLARIKDHAFSLNRLWDQMLHNKRLFGLRYPGKWCDVGHPEGITLAEDILRNAHV